jgi:lipopolysaccharide heptosyltransferase I
MKALILKPSSLGDVVQALPVLRLLKRQYPACEVWWWIDGRFAALLEGDRDLAGIVRFERERWGRPRHWSEMLASIRWLRAQRFDWVIDLQGLARSGAFAWLANGRLLAGLDEAREGARGLYDIIAPRASWHTHAVDWYLSLLPLLGVPVDDDFDWLPPRPVVAAAIQEKWSPRAAQRVALLPGARWTNKRWPLEHFAALVEAVSAQRPEVEFIVLGGREDAAAGRALAFVRPDRVLDLTGQTSLTEMIEWLRLCTAVVANDTGGLHVAAALGKPVVALFGPTEPRRTGPYRQAEHVLQQRALPCVPCMKAICAWEQPLECLRRLTPQLAGARLLAVLGPR